MSLPPGTPLGPYEILAPLGAGGMGEVWRARDTRLGREVAIKVLPVEVASEADRVARFEREARVLAALSHPNILAIHDFGKEKLSVRGAEGPEAIPSQEITYAVTELLEGETLRERLRRERLPWRKAVEIAAAMADGLAAAHGKGIIHRDLKPENVFVTADGRVKILDFGLARLAASPLAEAQTFTSPPPGTLAGAVLGTVGYMAPEQVRGEAADARSDLFALGCVLYEMLTGERAFKRDTAAETMTAILREPAPEVSTSGVIATPELNRIVAHCLEKQPAERFQSASDLAYALRANTARPEGAHIGQHETRDERPSIAVLPFANLSADKDNEYFSDGLAEDIIDALTHLPGLRVMARTSAFAFRGKEADVREIGARLNVEHILEGSVRRAANRVRVTAQLVKASDGYHLWSQRFDREMTDVFAIQDEISQAIVEKLRVQLAGGGALVKRHTDNVEAYHLFLRGRHCGWRMTREFIAKGRAYLEQAIALDPDYAQAYAAIADSYLGSAFWGLMDPREALPRAKAAAMAALDRDDTVAEAHVALGSVKGLVEFDWAGAEQRFLRALELNPASADTQYRYGSHLLRPVGRLEEAMLHIRRALELDPLSPLFSAFLAHLHWLRGEHGLAAEHRLRAIDLDPGAWFPHWLQAVEHEHLGKFEEAIAEAEKAYELSGGNAPTAGVLGRAYGLAGRRAEAEAILNELTAARRSAYVPAHAIAMVYRGLGDVDRDLEWVERGVEERDLLIITGLTTEPRYSPLRDHPRYHALLRKMNLEP